MNFNKTSFGSIKCENLLNCDISTSKGMEEVKEKEYFNIKCIELPSPKGVGFVIHRNELNGLLESYSFSKRLTFRSPYGRMMTNYWLFNLSSLFTKEISFHLKIRGEKDY